MFASLTTGITSALRKIFGAQKLTQSHLDEALAEVRAAMLGADVHYKVVGEILERVKTECVGQKVLEGVTPSQQVVKLIHDELVRVLGSAETPLNAERPLKIILCGLQGSGKTTTASKLALLLKKQGLSVTLVACDLQRPAAIDQLEILSRQVGAGFFKLSGAKNPTQVAHAALENLRGQENSAIMFDTAGRLQIDAELMSQLEDLQKNIRAQERLLVVDTALGQQSVAVAQGFDSVVGLTGLVLAKLDGDARGGAALSIRSMTGVPIRYLGVGEKPEDFEIFYPERMAGRILGMGDVVSLVEQAQEKIDADEAKVMAERAMSEDFSLEDLLKQFQQMKKMGDMGKLMQMVPGMNNVSIGSQEKKRMALSEAIILSMTPRERRNPQLVAGSRLLRVAKGAGVPLKDVNALLKQFNQMRDMMRMMKGGKGREMMRRMEEMKKRPTAR